MAVTEAEIHERAARQAKATRLAAYIHANGVTADLVENHVMEDDNYWRHASRAAGVRMPSAETRALVVRLMRAMERPSPEDPFEGLV